MKVKFWIKSSRQTDIEQVVEVPDHYKGNEDLMRDALEVWCDKFGCWDGDGRIKYGYDDEIDQDTPLTDGEWILMDEAGKILLQGSEGAVKQMLWEIARKHPGTTKHLHVTEYKGAVKV